MTILKLFKIIKIIHTFHHQQESTNWRKSARKFLARGSFSKDFFLAHGTINFSRWKYFTPSPFALPGNFPIHSFLFSIFLFYVYASWKNLICFQQRRIHKLTNVWDEATQWQKEENSKIISRKNMKVKLFFTGVDWEFLCSENHNVNRKKRKRRRS